MSIETLKEIKLDINKIIYVYFATGLLTSTGVILFFISDFKESEWVIMGLIVLVISLCLAIFGVKIKQRIEGVINIELSLRMKPTRVIVGEMKEIGSGVHYD